MRLGFKLSNRVTDTLESSSILIYLETRKRIYIHKNELIPYLIKWLIKKGDLKLSPTCCIFRWERKQPKKFGGEKNMWVVLYEILMLTPNFILLARDKHSSLFVGLKKFYHCGILVEVIRSNNLVAGIAFHCILQNVFS